MSTESSPLLSGRLSRLSGDAEMAGVAQEEAPLVVGSASGGGGSSAGHDPARQLSTFFGVIVPTVLSMFSIVVFMRVGTWLALPRPVGWGAPGDSGPSGQADPGQIPLGGEGGREGGWGGQPGFPAGGGAQRSPLPPSPPPQGLWWATPGSCSRS